MIDLYITNNPSLPLFPSFMKTSVYALAALLCLLLTPFASRAFSPIPGHVYEIRNRYTGRSLEVGGGDRNVDGHGVNLWGYWGGAHQQWQFERIGTTGNEYKITNRNSRQALQMDGSIQAITDRISEVRQSWSSGGNVWNFVDQPAPSGGVTISRRYVLTGGGGTSAPFLLRTNAPYGYPNTSYSGLDTVVASPNADDHPDQFVWDIIDRSAATPGVFRIMNVNSGKALSAGEDNGVSQQPMWYLAGQEWTFSDYNADGYLSIISRNTGQVLEIGGGDWDQPGANANVWDGYGHAWQQWRLVSTDGFNRQLTVQEIFTTGIPCKLLNRHSGLVLEIGGTASQQAQDGRAANQWYDYNHPWQQWNIYIDSNYRGTATATGKAADSAGALTLYPNPASSTLQVTLPGNRDASQVTLTDAQGRTVPVAHQHGKVDVSGLAAGLYIVSATDGQKTFRQKFVKE